MPTYRAPMHSRLDAVERWAAVERALGLGVVGLVPAPVAATFRRGGRNFQRIRTMDVG